MSLAALVLLTAFGAAADDMPTVVGTVVDVQNQPVAGADVSLFEGPLVRPLTLSETGPNTRQPPPLIARTKSDETGAFEIALPADAQTAYGTRVTWFALAVHQPGLALATRLIGRDWPARAAPIRVALDRPRNHRVRIVSPEGQPVAEARLWVEQLDGILLPAELAKRLATVSDDSGEAELPDVAGEQLRTLRVDSRQYGHQWAALARSPDGALITASLAPVGAVRGRLVDEAEHPIASTRVSLASWTDPRDEWSGGGLAEATTDGEGRFETAALAAGVLQIAASLPPDSPLISTYHDTQSLEAATTNEVVVRFQHGVRVRGTVVDEADGSPVAGAVRSFGFVRAGWVPLGAVFECDEAGKYSGYLPPGQASLTLVGLSPDYYDRERAARDDSVPEDATEVTLDPIRVKRGETLVGSVVDKAGRPVADAQVIGVCPKLVQGQYAATARSDRDGNFLLTRVAPNADVQLWAVSAAGATAEPLVVPTPNRDWLTLTVDPSTAWSLSGRVVNTAGRPIAGAAVRILQRSSPFSPDDGYVTFDGHVRLYTDAAGRFTTPGQLRPGRRYQIDIDALGMMPERTELIEATTKPTTDFGDIVLTPVPRVRSLAGQVVDESGSPVAGAIIKQSGDGPRRTRSVSDAEGRFRIDGVYEGAAWLFASHDDFGSQVERIASDASEARIVLRSKTAAQPAPVRHARLAVEPEDEAVIRTLFEENRAYLERESGAGHMGRRWVATIDYLLDGKLSKAPDSLEMDFGGAPAFLWLTPEQLQELADATTDPYRRAFLFLDICDALVDAPDRQRGALAEALLAGRAVDDAYHRGLVLREVSIRFFDLGDREIGAALVREAREQLATEVDNGLDPDVWQGTIAAALAHVDAPAALALARKPRTTQRDIFLADVASSLAAENPAVAEQAIEQVRQYRFEYCAGAVYRMATVDPQRAERITSKFSLPSRQAYLLGLIAHAQAATNQALAARLLEEAYALLEQSLAEGTADARDSPCGTAAALLVMVERVDSTMIDHYLARALAMRPPRPQRPAQDNLTGSYEGAIAEMALAIVRYDRQTARALLEPLAHRIHSSQPILATVRQRYWTAAALVDPQWALELIQQLPEPAPGAASSRRAAPARYVIEALTHRGAWRWPWVYLRCLQRRHPDTPATVGY
ncbi:MAG TPA: carboxypeptidase-like regulatory domain-containing protein [Pirellulales bacterium]|nr:carboxypeptidase-like regulatory domain-containing protein [Pirellulales bacterium]